MNQSNIKIVIDSVLDNFKITLLKIICPDQEVCSVCIENSNPTYLPKLLWKRKNINYDVLDIKYIKIILVMESPHKDEFDCNNNSTGAANGKTGDNLSTYLNEIIISEIKKGKFPDGIYSLILINAINFQCSLGFPTGYFRDMVFIGLWFKGGKEYFIERIKKLALTKNDVILNCCTQGEHKHFRKTFGIKKVTENFLKSFFDNTDISYCKSNLKELVSNAISEIKTDAEVLTYPHPITWNEETIKK